MYIFALPDLDNEGAKELRQMPREKRQSPRPMWERKKLEDMIHCADCHDCIVRKMILLCKRNPEKLCEHCIEKICALEESRWAHTLEEVGQILGVTRERTRQIEEKAIRRLRHPKKARRLKPFYLDSLARGKENGRPFQTWKE